MRLLDFFRRRDLAPKHLAAAPIQPECNELFVLQRRNEHALPPHARRGNPGGHRHLPNQITFRAECDRRFISVRDSLAIRSPELRPRGRCPERYATYAPEPYPFHVRSVSLTLPSCKPAWITSAFSNADSARRFCVDSRDESSKPRMECIRLSAEGRSWLRKLFTKAWPTRVASSEGRRDCNAALSKRRRSVSKSAVARASALTLSRTRRSMSERSLGCVPPSATRLRARFKFSSLLSTRLSNCSILRLNFADSLRSATSCSCNSSRACFRLSSVFSNLFARA